MEKKKNFIHHLLGNLGSAVLIKELNKIKPLMFCIRKAHSKSCNGI